MDQFVGEIRSIGRAFVSPGFLPCDGRQLNIAEYRPLFEVIGNRFGGDGATTFQLPDLRGRSVVHYSLNQPFGQAGGSPTLVAGSTPSLSGAAVTSAGSGQLSVSATQGDNYQPSLGVMYVIAVEGISPSVSWWS